MLQDINRIFFLKLLLLKHCECFNPALYPGASCWLDCSCQTAVNVMNSLQELKWSSYRFIGKIILLTLENQAAPILKDKTHSATTPVVISSTSACFVTYKWPCLSKYCDELTINRLQIPCISWQEHYVYVSSCTTF